ncbi:hypothetical protein Plhal304r1_c007g0027941 [Plasmopara halstedii]
MQGDKHICLNMRNDNHSSYRCSTRRCTMEPISPTSLMIAISVCALVALERYEYTKLLTFQSLSKRQ